MINFGSGILENILVSVALIAFGWLIRVPLLIPFVFGRRQRQLRFFGLTKQCPRQTVYLSTLFIQVGGAQDFNGTPRSFSGPAVADYELKVIPILDDLWEAPLLDSLPPFIRKQLAQVNWSFNNIEPSVESSPRDKKDVIHGGCVLTIGS